MTPEVLAFQADADPCQTLNCDERKESLRECEKARCCFAFQRSREEDQVDRDRKDAARSAEG